MDLIRNLTAVWKLREPIFVRISSWHHDLRRARRARLSSPVCMAPRTRSRMPSGAAPLGAEIGASTFDLDRKRERKVRQPGPERQPPRQRERQRKALQASPALQTKQARDLFAFVEDVRAAVGPVRDNRDDRDASGLRGTYETGARPSTTSSRRRA